MMGVDVDSSGISGLSSCCIEALFDQFAPEHC